MADELSKSEEAAFAAMQDAERANEPALQPEAGDEDAAAPEAEAGGVEAGEERRQKFVPHEALHEERLRRQAVESENRRLAEERARFDERLRIILDMNGPQPPAPRPDAKSDPLGTIEHLDQRLAAIEAGSLQQAEQAAEAARLNQLAEVAKAEAWEFARKTPDYGDAYNHFIAARDAELALFGYPPAVRANLITQEELQIAAQAFQSGRSPAATVYALARSRGFKGKAGGDGASGDAAEAQIERIASGQARGKTLSVGGGSAGGGEMTAAKLLAMSNDEFDAWTSRNPAKARRLMGG